MKEGLFLGRYDLPTLAMATVLAIVLILGLHYLGVNV
jgi:hypothetical protein